MRIDKNSSNINTFSIAALDMNNGDLGIAVASRVLAVGTIVPYAKSGIGVVATQSVANITYGSNGLKKMAEGEAPKSIIQNLTSKDPDRDLRQVGMVNHKGESFAFTGKDASDWKGNLIGEGFSCQGNLLTGEIVLYEMVRTFSEAAGELPERLMAALLAGDRAGGDRRGRQSVAILVVREANPFYNCSDDNYLGLRVDHHPNACDELNTVFSWWKQYVSA